MLVFTDPKELLARIDADAPAWRLVAIDGWLGAGKSTLAKTLSSYHPGQLFLFDLDCFRFCGIDAYIDALNWPALTAAFHATHGRIVFAGVCMKEALARLGVEADKHVYVKLMPASGWTHEGYAIGEDLETYARAGFPATGLTLEVRRYHDRFAPHLNADYEFHDLACDQSRCR